jgi:hypothetical protein
MSSIFTSSGEEELKIAVLLITKIIPPILPSNFAGGIFPWFQYFRLDFVKVVKVAFIGAE